MQESSVCIYFVWSAQAQRLLWTDEVYVFVSEKVNYRGAQS